jgi:THO complex subunit 2
MQIYKATEAFLKRGRAFKVGKGENIWHHVHVADLSDLYLLLGEAATNNGARATWNEEGYYLAEYAPFVWGEVLENIAKISYNQGLLQDSTAETLPPTEADRFLSHASYAIGTNSRGKSIRAKKLLGWQPVHGNLMDELSEAVDREARNLGLITGHAAKAAGEVN